MTEKTVIIIATQRSGTSPMAALLHFLGVNVNPTIRPSVINPKGGYEDVNWVHLSHLAAKGESDNNLQARVKNLVLKYDTRPVWGFKLNTGYKLLDMALPYMTNPYFIFVERNAIDTAISWKNHLQVKFGVDITLHKALHSIIKQKSKIKSIAKQYNNIPQITVTYNELQQDFLGVAKTISEFLGIKLKGMEGIQDFIIPNYSSFKENNMAVSTNYKKIYTKAYFDKHAYLNDDFNKGHFYNFGIWLYKMLDFTSCIDVGCGYGNLLNVLHNLGKVCHGVDISSYIISSNLKKAPHFSVDALPELNTIKGTYDLSIAYHVLEHLTADDVKHAMLRLFQISNKYCLIAVPLAENTSPDTLDNTHLTIKSRAWWLDLIIDCGGMIKDLWYDTNTKDNFIIEVPK